MTNANNSMTTTNNWKTKLLVGGAVGGALIGLITAYLMARTAEGNNQDGLPAVATGDLLKVAISVIGVARGIADLGNSK